MVPTLLAILTLGMLYWFPIRRWMSRWGTTQSDRARVMAGDSLLVDPMYSGTTAVTVNASPEHIWPWLVQIGYQRGGLYSYDWLDRLFGYLDRPAPPAFSLTVSASPLVMPFPSGELRAGRWQPFNPVAHSCWT